MGKYRKMTIKMTYEVIILGHLHMPLYFIGTFTEYPYLCEVVSAVIKDLKKFVLSNTTIHRSIMKNNFAKYLIRFFTEYLSG